MECWLIKTRFGSQTKGKSISKIGDIWEKSETVTRGFANIANPTTVASVSTSSSKSNRGKVAQYTSIPGGPLREQIEIIVSEVQPNGSPDFVEL